MQEVNINGCKARIKFTHKKNNVKFFSTWNKEGKLHDKGCPYYVEYKGKKGREKLNAYYKSIELDDDTILRRMKRKYNELHTENGEDEYTIPNQGSMKVENRGERDVEVGINSVNGEMQKDDSYIRYKDANYVTVDDLGRILSVYGKIDNVWIGENKDGTKFAYINYITENTSVSILFSEGFYVNEDSNGTEEFERFIKKIKALVETSVEPVEIIAYGEISKKKREKKGVNILVINPKRVLINNMTYNEILYKDINV